ncbi:MarR family winged helix-turn-helix transcriptional regulator [Tessaracoccus sp. Y1736]
MDTSHPDHEPQDLGSLFHAAFRGLRSSWAEQLSPWEITPFQWRALHTLARADGGLRLKDLAERLRIAPRSATEVVDQLESAGLVDRTPDPGDRRAVIVAPTSHGLEIHDAVMSQRKERSEEYFAVLSPAEQDQLAALLTLLAGTHGEHLPR